MKKLSNWWFLVRGYAMGVIRMIIYSIVVLVLRMIHHRELNEMSEEARYYWAYNHPAGDVISCVLYPIFFPIKTIKYLYKTFMK